MNQKGDKTMDNNELNLNQMEEAAGGRGGSRTKLPEIAGFDVIKIEKGTNLTRIARKYGTTVDFLVKINSTITDANDITAGYYMYVPEIGEG